MPRGLSRSEAKALFKARNFFSSDWNRRGAFANELADNGDGTVVDRATGLTWQQGGSEDYVTLDQAQSYLRRLNRQGFGGWRDWRLPTLEEAGSLLEREQGNGAQHVAALFDPTQQWIWTSDEFAAGSGRFWLVGFRHGEALWSSGEERGYVRACRAGGTGSRAGSPQQAT